MKKIWRIFTVILCMAFAFPASADEAPFTEKQVPVISDGAEDGELALRFYDETPNVPYMGINEYSQYMKGQSLTLRENEDGTCSLVNDIGEELVCNVEKGSILVNDWNRFFDLPLPLENEALGWKDSITSFIRITDVAFEGEPEPVTLDFAKYGIKIYSDSDDIYLPVAEVSNIMTDIATNHMLWNGEKLYAQRMDFEGAGAGGFYDSEMYNAELAGTARPEDVVKQCYADLCFNLDYFFGHPGIAVLDEALAEKGLDQALTDLGENGLAIKEGLLSSDLGEYISALNKLFAVYLSDGHTVFSGGTAFLKAFSGNGDKISAFMNSLDFVKDTLLSPSALTQTARLLIPIQRASKWGSETYREYGNTAMIRLDDFLPDEKAWDSYYKGDGEFPDDCLGTVVRGLQKASENPAIENVIFDLSGNSGGSPDVLMTILAMTTGQNQLYGIQKLTGQRMIFTFETDTNFDGVYDEKDKEVRYDFNYGVLVTRCAFSCGNLFPIIIQEGGAVLIGEPSGGGSCCIQIGSDTEGLSYLISSCQWQLTDSEGVDVEGGCKIDLPIEPVSNEVVDLIAGMAGIDEGIPSFLGYYDDAMLDEMMNSWFSGQADLAA